MRLPLIRSGGVERSQDLGNFRASLRVCLCSSKSADGCSLRTLPDLEVHFNSKCFLRPCMSVPLSATGLLCTASTAASCASLPSLRESARMWGTVVLGCLCSLPQIACREAKSASRPWEHGRWLARVLGLLSESSWPWRRFGFCRGTREEPLRFFGKLSRCS